MISYLCIVLPEDKKENLINANPSIIIDNFTSLLSIIERPEFKKEI